MRAVSAEDGKDDASPNRKIMNDSEEVNKLKALCRKHKGESYPPEEVKRHFEHLRPYLKIAASENKNAEEGIFTVGRRFIKDEII